jgi:hypothetical protein
MTRDSVTPDKSRERLIANGLALVKPLITQPELVRKFRTEGVILGDGQRIRARWYRGVEAGRSAPVLIASSRL